MIPLRLLDDAGSLWRSCLATREKLLFLFRPSRRGDTRDRALGNLKKTGRLTRDSIRDESPHCLAVLAFPHFKGKASETRGRDGCEMNPA
jgi:hypothetical protein